jgi:hypothetical protein
MAKAAVKKKVAKTKAGFLNAARDDKLSKDWGKAIEEAKKLANDNKPSSKTKTKTRTPRGTPRGGGSFTAEVYDETMKLNKGTNAKPSRGTPRGTSGSSGASRSAASRFTAEVYDETMKVGKSRASQVGGAFLRGGLRVAGPVGALIGMTQPAGEGSDKPSGPLMRGNADRGPQRPRYKPSSGPKNRQPLPKNKSLATAATAGPGRMGSQTVTAPKRIGVNATPPGGPPSGARPSVAAAAATAASAVNNKGAAPKGTTPTKRYKNARERRMAERYAIGTSGRPM